MVCRSDLDGKTRMLIGTATKEVQLEQTALRELTARLFEFESAARRNRFLSQNTDSEGVVARLLQASKLRYQAVCASGPGTNWKLGDLANLQKTGTGWSKDGAFLYVEAQAEIKGIFTYHDGPGPQVAHCEFKDVPWEKTTLLSCEGSKPCLLVLDSRTIGKLPPKALPEANDDPFGDPFN
ncbi:MAG: hypothetical protein AAF514_09710 [Verrucomicrobiota bacterium]